MVHQVVGLHLFHILALNGLVHQHRHQLHGAGIDALATAQAPGLLHGVLVALAQHGDGIDALDGGHIQVILGNAHHGAAGEDLVGILGMAAGIQQVVEGGADGHQQDALDGGHIQVILGNAHHGAAGEDLVGILGMAAGIQQVVEGGADGHQQVLRLHEDVTGDGHDPLDQRHAVVNHIVNGFAGGSVEHSATHSGRQSTGGDLPAGDGVNQLFFCTLWVLGRQHVHLDGIVGVGQQGLNGLRLVVLDADVAFLQAENPQNQLQAANQLLRLPESASSRQSASPAAPGTAGRLR